MTLSKFIRTSGWLCLALFPAFAMAGEDQTLWQGDLIKKSKAIEGHARIVAISGERVIVFDDNFKTKDGPDLKVVLSPLPFDKITGKNAMKDARVISLLKATSGGQRYTIPADIDLSAMKSLLVHCEKYSVLWGGAPLD